MGGRRGRAAQPAWPAPWTAARASRVAAPWGASLPQRGPVPSLLVYPESHGRTWQSRPLCGRCHDGYSWQGGSRRGATASLCWRVEEDAWHGGPATTRAARLDWCRDQHPLGGMAIAVHDRLPRQWPPLLWATGPMVSIMGPSGKRKSVVQPFLIEYQRGGGILVSICSGCQQTAERRWQSLSRATGRRSDTDGARTAAHRPSRAYVLSCPRRPRCALGLQWAIGSGHRSAQRKEPRQAKPSRHEMKWNGRKLTPTLCHWHSLLLFTPLLDGAGAPAWKALRTLGVLTIIPLSPGWPPWDAAKHATVRRSTVLCCKSQPRSAWKISPHLWSAIRTHWRHFS